MSFHTRNHAWIAVALALVVHPPVQAQEIESTDVPPGGGGVIEEIVVTAQKRENTLQDTAISITALTEEGIRARGIRNALDLTDYIPNVNLAANAQGDGFFINMRSINQSDAGLITRDQPASVYIDGVYWGRSQGNLIDVVELTRVEVLRGPQGDLYGRNSSAGAINFITRKPSGEWGSELTATAGKFSQTDFRIYQEFPLLGDPHSGSGFLGGSLSIASLNRDGFYKNNIGEDTESRDRIALRGALRWQTGGLTADLSVDYTDAKESQTEYQLTHVFADATHSTAMRVVPLISSYANPERAAYVNVDGCEGSNYPDRGPCSHNEDELEVLGGGLTLSGESAGGTIFKSVTGYRSVESSKFIDRDGTPLIIFGNVSGDDISWWNQEFNLVGSTDGGFGQFDYVLGAFFLREKGDQFSYQWALNEVFGATAGTGPRKIHIETDAWALFGHFTWTPPVLDERLSFEAGLRQTWEDKEVGTDNRNCRNTCPFLGRAQRDFSAFTPTGRIRFRVNDGLNAYVSVSKGYTAGGFNGRANTQALLDTGYNEETVLSYEAGIKFQGWENRLRLNLAGFLMDYEDLQRTALAVLSNGTIGSTTVNAGRAEVNGLELELLWAPLDNLLINASYGLSKADYKEFIDNGVNVADTRNFGQTPENNVSAGIEYTIGEFSFGRMVLRSDFYWQDETLLQNGDEPLAGDDPYEVVNARLTLYDARLPGLGGTFDISLFGKNILDEHYRPFGIDYYTSSGRTLPWIVQGFGPPRTYGIEIEWSFGSMVN